jgi:hypothetical protein
MAKCMQCGGSTKMKKMKTGGSMGIVGMPKYSNDPRTDAGRTLKKGGSAKGCPDGYYWSVQGCQKKVGGHPGLLSTTGAKLGVGSVLLGALGMGASAIKNKIKNNRVNKKEAKEVVKTLDKAKVMKMGGSLKPVPADKVGLSKLPKAVRNKMGYMKKGGVKKK